MVVCRYDDSLGKIYIGTYEADPDPEPVPAMAVPIRKLSINFKADTIYGDLVFDGKISIDEIEEAKRYLDKDNKQKSDIRLNSSHDLFFINNDIDLIYGIDCLRQKLKIKLQLFYKEWFLDTTLGIDFFNIVYVKNPDLNLIDNVIKMTILETEGIKQLTEYYSELILE